MVVDDAEVAPLNIEVELQLDPILYRAQVVAQMNKTTRLNAWENDVISDLFS